MNRKILHKIYSFSTPLVAGQLTYQTVSIVSGIISGRISPKALQLISVMDNLSFSLLGVMGTAAVAFSLLAAQTDDRRQYRDYFSGTLVISTLLGVAGGVLLQCTHQWLLTVWYRIPAVMLPVACQYSRLVSVNMFLTMLVFALAAHVKLQRRTGLILAAVITATVMQVGFLVLGDLVLTDETSRVLNVGVAQLVGNLAQVIVYTTAEFKQLHDAVRSVSTKKRVLLEAILPLSGQEILESLLVEAGLVVLVSRQGPLIFAGYTICRRLVDVALIYLFPNVQALIVLGGAELRQSGTVRKLLRYVLWSTMSVYAMFSMLIMLNITPLLALFSRNQQVINQAYQLIIVVGLLGACQIGYEQIKAVLQLYGLSRYVLRSSTLVNCLLTGLLFALQAGDKVSVYGTLAGICAGTLCLTYLFYRKYVQLI